MGNDFTEWCNEHFVLRRSTHTYCDGQFGNVKVDESKIGTVF